MRDYGDSNNDGLIDYQRGADTGLSNQGWKDSEDSIFHADGRFPKGPVALLEVQGYAYAAWRAMAELAVTLDLFRNDVDNFIEQQVYDPLMGIPGFEQHTTWVNVDKARLTGYELDARYRWQATRVGLAIGQTKGEDRNSGEALYGIPARKGVLDLSQGLWQEDLLLGTRITYVASQGEVPADNAVAEYDSYALWDLYLAWQPAMGSLSGLRVDLAVDNLTDRYYRQAWQTLYEQGRNARLGVTYSF